MREELAKATLSFLKNLDFSKIPEIPIEFEYEILCMAMYVAFMRANVWSSYENGYIVDMEVIGSEVPTRIAKQLKHLVKLLAIVRGHNVVTEKDMATLGRVARDTAETKKQAIIDHFVKYDKSLELSFDSLDIAGHIRGLFRVNVKNHLKVLEALDCVQEESDNRFSIKERFKEYIWVVYRIKIPVAYNKKRSKLDDFK
jgi:hypothetical protein